MYVPLGIISKLFIPKVKRNGTVLRFWPTSKSVPNLINNFGYHFCNEAYLKTVQTVPIFPNSPKLPLERVFNFS
jgi:hypothetical protein